MVHDYQQLSLIKKAISSLVAGLCVISLSGCAPPLFNQANADEVRGALLVWHTWPQPESQFIHGLLDDFMSIHPRVTIVAEYVPNNQLSDEFIANMAAGLGPDLLIGAELPFIEELVNENLLFDLSFTDVVTNTLLSHAVEALAVDEHLYGIPFAAYTDVLFYNRTIIEQPVTTVEQLLEEAREGTSIAIPTDFYHSYWGVRIFGGQIIDDDGELSVNEGITEWLEWLLMAQREGILLSPDYEELRHTFMEGDSAYFVGSSSDLPQLEAALGMDNVGVALLPRRSPEEGEEASSEERILNQLSPGSFLELEVMSISDISAKKRLALDVIEFFANQTHQREIAKANFGQIPVNKRVRIDPRFSPNESMLIRQSRSSVIIPLAHVAMEKTLLKVGTDVFNRVLEGVILPDDAIPLIRDGVEDEMNNSKEEEG